MSSEKWGFAPEKVAYMKSNALDEEFRGKGFGRMLLDKSIAECKRAGADAAVAHVWRESPGNSAVNYFSRAGGQLIATYPLYWSEGFHGENSPCSRCGVQCQCSGAEMIIDFSKHTKGNNCRTPVISAFE